jgi:hypothetical protein
MTFEQHVWGVFQVRASMSYGRGVETYAIELSYKLLFSQPCRREICPTWRTVAASWDRVLLATRELRVSLQRLTLPSDGRAGLGNLGQLDSIRVGLRTLNTDLVVSIWGARARSMCATVWRRSGGSPPQGEPLSLLCPTGQSRRFSLDCSHCGRWPPQLLHHRRQVRVLHHSFTCIGLELCHFALHTSL